MGKGSSSPQKQEVTQTTTNLPEYAQPYVMDIFQRAQAESNREYTPYEGQRIAPLTPQQQAINQEAFNLQAPAQIGQASTLAQQAAKDAATAGKFKAGTIGAQNINAPNLQQYQMDPVLQVLAQQYAAPGMGAAQTYYDPSLYQYLIDSPESFGQAQANQYMTPYIQSVLDVQKREAITDAQKAQLVQDLGAGRQGTYGGARQLLAGTERERALGQQLGDIQARGLQSAYENAQQQFERDRAARLGVSGQNLQSLLQTQELGVNTGLQTALANLSSYQQANVQNLAAILQTQGLNADQALRAALANQQAGLDVGKTNLAALLGIQELGSAQQLAASQANQQAKLDAAKAQEAARAAAANIQLGGAQTAAQAADRLGALGVAQQQADLARLQAQATAAAQEQALQQQQMDLAYADFLRQQDYPLEQLGYYNNLIRGQPLGLNSTATTYAQPPSAGAQIAGTGLGALSLAKLAGA
jgi:hypothetical protein